MALVQFTMYNQKFGKSFNYHKSPKNTLRFAAPLHGWLYSIKLVTQTTNFFCRNFLTVADGWKNFRRRRTSFAVDFY